MLYPTGHRQGRLWIHTLDPITEAVAIEECERMDREQAEAATELADLIARQEQPDPEELARMIEDEQEAADQAARQEDEEYEADQADTYEYVD